MYGYFRENELLIKCINWGVIFNICDEMWDVFFVEWRSYFVFIMFYIYKIFSFIFLNMLIKINGNDIFKLYFIFF